MDWAEFPGHDTVLQTERLTLRPFRESDFEIALGYYADREFRDMMEGDPDAPVNLEYLRAAGLYMASWGWLFAIELKAERRSVGEACLQRMNLERAAVQPGEVVFRVPLAIWDKRLWGLGLGGEVLDKLLEWAFVAHNADRVCAMDAKEGNVRSQQLFTSRGFRVVRRLDRERVVDLELTRAEYLE